nr:MAG TPA: Protein of unknown function (DUF1617) [Caudoviricetes sp.]
MVVRKTMTNLEIYNIASTIVELLNKMTEENITLPIKANFYFQKNANTLTTLAKELEEERSKIISKYGTPVEGEEGKVTIDPDKVDEANTELFDLFNLEQEVAVNMIDIDSFGNVEMTPTQMAAITFMIKDDEE